MAALTGYEKWGKFLALIDNRMGEPVMLVTAVSANFPGTAVF